MCNIREIGSDCPVSFPSGLGQGSAGLVSVFLSAPSSAIFGGSLKRISVISSLNIFYFL